MIGSIRGSFLKKEGGDFGEGAGDEQVKQLTNFTLAWKGKALTLKVRAISPKSTAPEVMHYDPVVREEG